MSGLTTPTLRHASLLSRLCRSADVQTPLRTAPWRGPRVEREPPSGSALRTDGLAVIAMVVALLVGASSINNVLERPDAVLVWVVFVVGAHFLLFAGAFDLPVFRWVGVSLVRVSIIGAIPVLAFNSANAAGATAVAAGFLLLLFAAARPRLSRRTTAPCA